MKPLEQKLEMESQEILSGSEQCLKCRFCATGCPLFDGPYLQSNVGKMQAIRHVLAYGYEPTEYLRDLLYYCSTCGKCEYLCSRLGAGLKTVDMLETARWLLLTRYKMTPIPKHTQILESLKENSNPYLEPHNDRFSWLHTSLPLHGDYIYFVGCTSAYRVSQVAQATVAVFNKFDVDIALPRDEKCCGSVFLRTGFIDHLPELIEENTKILNQNGTKGVITSCAGCYRTFKKDYPKFTNLDTEIFHSVEVMDKLITKEQVTFKERLDGVIATYHDPCHLGRHTGVYEAPRNIISQIPGLEFIEMPTNREEATCCGAGGGFRSSYTEKSLELAVNRLKEAKHLGAEMLISCCPFCELNLKDAQTKENLKIEVIDLMELIYRLI